VNSAHIRQSRPDSGLGFQASVGPEADLSHAIPQALRYFTEMCSGSEADSYSRLIGFVYHSTLGLGVIKKKKKTPFRRRFPPKSHVPEFCVYDGSRGVLTAHRHKNTVEQQRFVHKNTVREPLLLNRVLGTGTGRDRYWRRT